MFSGGVPELVPSNDPPVELAPFVGIQRRLPFVIILVSYASGDCNLRLNYHVDNYMAFRPLTTSAHVLRVTQIVSPHVFCTCLTYTQDSAIN